MEFFLIKLLAKLTRVLLMKKIFSGLIFLMSVSTFASIEYANNSDIEVNANLAEFSILLSVNSLSLNEDSCQSALDELTSEVRSRGRVILKITDCVEVKRTKCLQYEQLSRLCPKDRVVPDSPLMRGSVQFVK
jgi:hypothetical protein